MQDRGTMGETSGVIEWYEYRPIVNFETITGWKPKGSNDNPGVKQQDERGFREGWYRADFSDADWTAVGVPSWWEDTLGAS